MAWLWYTYKTRQDQINIYDYKIICILENTHRERIRLLTHNTINLRARKQVTNLCI